MPFVVGDQRSSAQLQAFRGRVWLQQVQRVRGGLLEIQEVRVRVEAAIATSCQGIVREWTRQGNFGSTLPLPSPSFFCSRVASNLSFSPKPPWNRCCLCCGPFPLFLFPPPNLCLFGQQKASRRRRRCPYRRQHPIPSCRRPLSSKCLARPNFHLLPGSISHHPSIHPCVHAPRVRSAALSTRSP